VGQHDIIQQWLFGEKNSKGVAKKKKRVSPPKIRKQKRKLEKAEWKAKLMRLGLGGGCSNQIRGARDSIEGILGGLKNSIPTHGSIVDDTANDHSAGYQSSKAAKIGTMTGARFAR